MSEFPRVGRDEAGREDIKDSRDHTCQHLWCRWCTAERVPSGLCRVLGQQPEEEG